MATTMERHPVFYLLVVGCLLTQRTSASNYTCPSGCMCDVTPGYTNSMSCDGVGLKDVIDNIPAGVRFLQVRNANITKLSPETFGEGSIFEKLNHLSLSENKIGLIEPGTFTVMPDLETLNVSVNLLRSASLSEDTFSGLSKLHTLDLSHNELDTESLSTLTTLTSLSSLVLSFNNISDLSCDVVGDINISSIERLELVDNYLTNLDSCLFLGSRRVQFLNLSSNTINSIKEDAFQTSHELVTLSLRNNDLEASDVIDALTVLRNLQVLSLTGNYLTEVPTAIQNMTRLKILYLSDNPIQALRSSDLSGLTDLEEFYFRRLPDLTLMEPGSLDQLPSLRVLAVEQNPLLKFIPLDSIPERNLQSLTSLLVSTNGIAGFGEKSFSGATSLQRALVGGNPLHCNCQVKWMKTVMEQAEEYTWAQEWLGPAGPSCNTPVSMKRMMIADISEEDLTCDEPVAVPLTPLDIDVPAQTTVKLQAILSGGIPTSTWFDQMGIPLKATSGGANLGTSSVTEVRLANDSVVTTATLSDVSTLSSGQYTLVVKNADKGTAMTFYVNVTGPPETPLLGLSLLAIQETNNTIIEGLTSSGNTTEGPSSNNTTEGPSSNNTTEGPSSNNTTEGHNTTEGPSSNNTAEGPSSNTTTEGPSSNNTTEGPSSNNTTEGPSSNNTTEGFTFSHEGTTINSSHFTNDVNDTTKSYADTTMASSHSTENSSVHLFTAETTKALITEGSETDIFSDPTSPGTSPAPSSTRIPDGIPTPKPDFNVNPRNATIVILAVLSIGVVSVLVVVLFRVLKTRRENQYSRLVEVELGPTKRNASYGSL